MIGNTSAVIWSILAINDLRRGMTAIDSWAILIEQDWKHFGKTGNQGFHILTVKLSEIHPRAMIFKHFFK